MKNKLCILLATVATYHLLISNMVTTVWADDFKAESEIDGIEMLYVDASTGESYTYFLPDDSSTKDSTYSNGNSEVIQPAHIDTIAEPSIDSRATLSKVSNVNVLPYSMIVMCRNGFDLDNNDEIELWTLSTGAMVYNDLIYTCAHGMYYFNYGKTAEIVEIRLKHHSHALSSSFYTLSGWHIPTQYTSNQDSKYDWSVLVASSSISTQWFGYGYSNNDITNKAVWSAGYPDDDAHHYYMYKTFGTMSSESDYRFSSNLYILGGQSGSPVYDSSYVIWGEAQSAGEGHNGYGCLVTKHVYNVIESLK